MKKIFRTYFGQGSVAAYERFMTFQIDATQCCAPILSCQCHRPKACGCSFHRQNRHRVCRQSQVRPLPILILIQGYQILPPRQRQINSDPKEHPLSEQGERRRGDFRQNGHINLLSVRTALRGVRSLELATEQVHGNHGTQRQNETDQSPDHRITSSQFCGSKTEKAWIPSRDFADNQSFYG